MAQVLTFPTSLATRLKVRFAACQDRPTFDQITVDMKASASLMERDEYIKVVAASCAKLFELLQAESAAQGGEAA